MSPDILTTVAMVALMFAAFYLLILRPQRKRQAEQRATLEALQPGSRVLTSTGIYATLLHMGDKQAVIELSPGHEMTVVKHAIVRVVDPADEDAFDGEDDGDDAVEDDTSFADDREPQGYVTPSDTPDAAWSADNAAASSTDDAATSTPPAPDAGTEAGRRSSEG